MYERETTKGYKQRGVSDRDNGGLVEKNGGKRAMAVGEVNAHLKLATERRERVRICRM